MKIDEAFSKATPGPLDVMDIPSVGLVVGWKDGEEWGPTCSMRWTDGMRPQVEERKKVDAALLAHCFNNFQELVVMLKKYREWCWDEEMREVDAILARVEEVKI